MPYSKRNLKNKIVLYGYFILFIILVFMVVIYHSKLKLIYSSPDTVNQFITKFRIFAPLTLIILQILQVFIFVIPGPIFTIAGGYIFGVALGTIYSLIGTLLGSILVFYLSKKYGRSFVEKIVNKKDLDHFDAYFNKRGKVALFITRLIPVLFPNDVVSFAAGLTPLSLRTYVIISFFGFIPNLFLLTFFGNELTYHLNPYTLIILSVLGFGSLIYLFRHPIKIFFIKEIRNFEDDMNMLEERTLKEIKILEKDLKYDFKRIENEVELFEKIIFYSGNKK